MQPGCFFQSILGLLNRGQFFFLRHSPQPTTHYTHAQHFRDVVPDNLVNVPTEIGDENGYIDRQDGRDGKQHDSSGHVTDDAQPPSRPGDGLLESGHRRTTGLLMVCTSLPAGRSAPAHPILSIGRAITQCLWKFVIDLLILRRR